MNTNTTYNGSCHCGAITFSVGLTETLQAMTCNCSLCALRQHVLTFVTPTAFTLHSGSEQITHYKFNKKYIDHQFCSICGVQAFSSGGEGDSAMIAINLRTLKDFDLGSLTPIEYDGAAL